jgi:hypothetical protein
LISSGILLRPAPAGDIEEGVLLFEDLRRGAGYPFDEQTNTLKVACARL